MNNKDNRETNNQSIIIEDLDAADSEEIKGGQTREHILLARQNPGGASGGSNQNSSVSSSDLASWQSNYGSN